MLYGNRTCVIVQMWPVPKLKFTFVPRGDGSASRGNNLMLNFYLSSLSGADFLNTIRIHYLPLQFQRKNEHRLYYIYYVCTRTAGNRIKTFLRKITRIPVEIDTNFGNMLFMEGFKKHVHI